MRAVRKVQWTTASGALSNKVLTGKGACCQARCGIEINPCRRWGIEESEVVIRSLKMMIRLNSYRYLGLHCGSPRSAHVSPFSLAILGDDTVQLAHDNSESLFFAFPKPLVSLRDFLLWHHKYGPYFVSFFFPEKIPDVVTGWWMIFCITCVTMKAWQSSLGLMCLIEEVYCNYCSTHVGRTIDNIDAMCGSSHCFLAFPIIDRWAYRLFRFALNCLHAIVIIM